MGTWLSGVVVKVVEVVGLNLDGWGGEKLGGGGDLSHLEERLLGVADDLLCV